MRSLLPPNFTRIFDLMELAEGEIKNAKRHFPERTDALQKAFKILVPTLNMTSADEKVYREHVRELLGRVGRGQVEGAELGTAAEVMLLFGEASFRAPLNQTPAALYARLFDSIFGDVELCEAAREPYPGAALELENELRRKCAVRERKDFIKETLHGHQASIFDLAA